MIHRRSFLRGLFTLAAAATVMPVHEIISGIKLHRQSVSYTELQAITRRTFAPRLHIQLYEASPFLKQLLLENAHDNS